MSLSPENYLPHRSTMRLIDTINTVNDQYASCAATIAADNIFYDANINGVYVWVGIEFMAQAAAVFASFQGKQAAPAIGFLVSVRNFKSHRPYFTLGETLTIIAHNEYLQDRLGVFQCQIIVDGQEVASAKLSAFQPPADQIDHYLGRV